MEKKTTYESLARIATIIALCELKVSTSNSQKLSSAHEGLALLQKHVDDLFASASLNRRAQLKVAKRVAAVAIRYMVEICLESEQNNERRSGTGSSGDRGSGGDGGSSI